MHESQQQEQATPFFAKSEDRAAQKPFFSTSSGAVQTKLSIGQPGDKYEREADSVADRVVNHSAGQAPAVQQKQEISSIQRLATPIEDEKLGTSDARMRKDKEIQEKSDPAAKEEEKPGAVQKMDAPKEEEKPGAVQKMDAPKEEEKPGAVQKMDAPKEEEKPGAVQKMDAPKEEEKPGVVQKMDAPKEEEKPGAVQKKDAPKEEEKAPVQAKSDAPATVSPALSGQIESSSGRGRQLPDKTRSEMEQGIGADFRGVNIHTDEEAAGMNRELGAQAFTHGQDIYFNNGKYNPDTSSGKRLLAHELTHVVQQDKGTIRKTEGEKNADPDKALRKEKFNEILAKGKNMTPAEAWMAKEILLFLTEDEFKTELKKLLAHPNYSDFEEILRGSKETTIADEIQQELVIPAVLFKPAPNTIDQDFENANKILNPYKIQVEKGSITIVEEIETKKVLGGKSAVPVPTEGKSKEMNAMIEKFAATGRITAFWVQDIQVSGKNEGDADTVGATMKKLYAYEDSFIIIDAKKTDSGTFAHEIIHALGLDYHPEDKDNLMFDTQKEWSNPKNELNQVQLDFIYMNVYKYLENGKKENETQGRKTVE